MPIQTVEKVIDASKEYFGVKVEPSEKDNEQEPSFGAFSYYDEDEEGSFSSEVRKPCYKYTLRVLIVAYIRLLIFGKKSSLYLQAY